LPARALWEGVGTYCRGHGSQPLVSQKAQWEKEFTFLPRKLVKWDVDKVLEKNKPFSAQNTFKVT
jgi:hypothetical protein